MTFILASSSPRRKELLESIGIVPDQILGPHVDETPLKGESIKTYVQRIALLKAYAIHAQNPAAYVLAADTAVEARRQIFLKAETSIDARKMLELFSGRRHRVYTAICGISPEGKEASRLVITRLTFKRLTLHEIDAYVATGEWEGKAGAYSIQGRAAKFVKFISGSYTNVVGLPLYETDCLLKGIGFRG
jgi:septum formation protein